MAAIAMKYILFSKIRKTPSFLVLCLFAAMIASAQGTGNTLFRQLSVNDGLSHSDVTAMVQDHSGFLWLGTHNGLNKYDGKTVQVFKNIPGDTSSLPNNRITVLLPDGDGHLWIGTERQGLSIYNEKFEKFTRVSLFASNKSAEVAWISGICIDDKGTLWVATKRGDLFAMEIRNEKVKIKSHILVRAANNKPLIINSMIYGATRYLWLATNKGIYIYNISSKSFSKVPASNNDISVGKIMLDNNGILWAGRKDGVFRLEGWNQAGLLPVFKKVQLPEAITQVESLFQDRRGSIWVGTLKNGVFRLTMPFSALNNGPQWKAEHVIKQINNTSFIGSIINIKCFFEDKYGVLWIGTAGGGAIYTNLKNNAFYSLNTKPNGDKPLSEDAYTSAVYAEPGRFWIGTRKGLCVYVPESGKTATYLPDRTIASIFKDKAGDYWIACAGNNEGLWRASGWVKGVPATLVPYEHTQSLTALNLTSIVEDREQRLWVSTYSNGINILSKDRSKVVHLKKENSDVRLASNHVTHLYQDPYYPYIWVSYRDAGLSKIEYFPDGTFKITHYTYKENDPHSLSSNFTWNVRRTRDSVLWIATLGGGLNKMVEENGRTYFQHYTVNEGLKDNDIESMEEDSDGNLWLAGYGLTKFDPCTGGVHFFDYTDGLQSNAFKVGASFRDHFGWLYFGGINGLNFFDPATVISSNISPDLVFTGLRVYNKTVKVGEELGSSVLLPIAINYCNAITLKASQNDFTIDFIGLQFAHPSKIRYRYKLAGYNKDWIETDFPSVSFAKLPKGVYELSVYAVADNGTASAIKKISIEMLPPWWQSGWAYALYLILITLAVYFSWNIIQRENRLKRSLLLAAKEKELHKRKLEFFTNISHELRTPMTLIYGPVTEFLEKGVRTPHAREKLWQIYRNTKRLLMLTNQLLDFRKMETGNMQIQARRTALVKFLKEIFLVFKTKAEEQQITYTFHAPETVWVYCDQAKMETVFINLLSNAFKHTPHEGTIAVSVVVKGDVNMPSVFKWEQYHKKLHNHYVEITVSDNGSGIPPEEIKYIFNSYYQASRLQTLQTAGTGLGLSIAKGIIQLHHGFIEVESELYCGTTFQVGLPLGKEHLSKNELAEEAEAPDAIASHEKTMWSFSDKNLSEGLEIHPASTFESLISESNENGETVEHPLYQLLIIEDNSELLQYLKNGLSKEYRVITASNGKEGLQKAQQYLPDIILSDVMMPEMDGLELCAKLKSDPSLNYIPVILLTARSATVYEIEGIETGADDYITKPFDFRLLRAKISRFLRSRQSVREYYQRLLSLENVTPTSNNADELFLNRLIECVETLMLEDDFNIKKLSREMAMSQSALYKRVKDLTGGSILDFVRNVRLKKAANLIATERMKISEAAAEVGIYDIKYFREQFKKLFGQTPSEYQKARNAEKPS